MYEHTLKCCLLRFVRKCEVSVAFKHKLWQQMVKKDKKQTFWNLQILKQNFDVKYCKISSLYNRKKKVDLSETFTCLETVI